MSRKYYEAYDDRYRQVHSKKLQWFHTEPSPIVKEIINDLGIQKDQTLLELGCGEGRDAVSLLKDGYQLLATDISEEAIRYCCEKAPEYAAQFSILDCVGGSLDDRFDYIYSVAVLHMLVNDRDRAAFYKFYYNHLKENGFGLICSMGDGRIVRRSDITTAFQLQERIHEQSGEKVLIAGTSCRMVSFDTMYQEMNENGLKVIKSGITSVEPDFPQMMFAVVQKVR